MRVAQATSSSSVGLPIQSIDISAAWRDSARAIGYAPLLLMHRPLLAFLLSLTAACSDELPTGAIEVWICAEGGCADRVIGLTTEADHRLWVAMFSFTDEDVARALTDAGRRGVDVKVLLDSTQAGQAPTIRRILGDGGVDFRLDGNSSLMHHKFAVVDSKFVATGSFNWTVNANRHNDENLVILHSDEVTDTFADEFSRVWAEGRVP